LIADKSGNGLAMRQLDSADCLDNGQPYERLTWTEKGDALAAVKGKEDVARTKPQPGRVTPESRAPQKVVFDPPADKTFRPA
jgi:hypothetical protein